ncbi:conjugative transposon protein TraN [Flavobacterium sp. RHBU_24]|uniref:conjugative transposon protein TraN n=1 Tax=Flavobacterium sp. RHBU_24 TaxID=3391185 RepID=UPI003984F62E
MKKVLLIIVMLIGLPFTFSAQDLPKELPVNAYLSISETCTTSLLFPYPIINVDRGSQDVLAQKPKGVENLLQIKAAQEDFMSTNLTVVTSDGKLYNFQVSYETEPLTYAYDFSSNVSPGPAMSGQGINDAQLDVLAAMAFHDRSRISISERDYEIGIEVTGMYIADDYIFYRIMLQNNSNISYVPDHLRFLVRDRKVSRRTASQETELLPVTVYQPVLKVPAKGMKTFVVVLPKFTIPYQKDLYLQLTEKDGGRHLQLKIKNSKAGKVIPLPSIK